MKLVIKRKTVSRSRRGGWLGGFALGAGLTYLTDPVSGRRRRSMVRDKAVHAAHAGEEEVKKGVTDLSHRSAGLLARAKSRVRPDDVSDPVLHARVRSELGRVCSHPGSVSVSVHDGHVTLAGPILTDEAARTVRRIRYVRGVRSVEDDLGRHDDAEHIPGLQGGRHRGRRTWTPAARLFGTVGGGGLILYGIGRRGLVGGLAGGAGVGLVVRAFTGLPYRRLLGLKGGRRGIDVQKDIHIDAPVKDVYAYFRDFENLPRFMSHLRAVHVDGEVSHWEAVGPAGASVSWDAELTHLEPEKIIRWESVPGSMIRSHGTVRFEEEHGGTRLRVRLSYVPPAGAVGHALASLFGTDPKHALDDDLLRLKTMLEEGKATAHGETVTRT